MLIEHFTIDNDYIYESACNHGMVYLQEPLLECLLLLSHLLNLQNFIIFECYNVTENMGWRVMKQS